MANEDYRDYLEIISRVAQGDSAAKACKDFGIKTSTFYTCISRDKDLGELYARAREDRGDVCVDRINEIQDDLINKKIDSNTARVLIDTQKWLASKFYPKMYGEKAENNIVNSVNIMPAVTINGQEQSFNIGDDESEE